MTEAEIRADERRRVVAEIRRLRAAFPPDGPSQYMNGRKDECANILRIIIGNIPPFYRNQRPGLQSEFPGDGEK